MAPIINEHYKGLGIIPWISIGKYPTRIEKLEKMGEAYGVPELYIKRDDCCHPVYGGNKIRKLEYLLADAQAAGKKLLITLGGAGSNQVIATGIFGREYGFDVIGVMMDQLNAEYVRKNLLLDHYYGVELVYTKDTLTEMLAFARIYASTWINGKKPYFVTAGASTPNGNLGFVNAVYELKQQIDEGFPEPDYIVVASGSLGTSAGLNLGCMLLGLKTRVIGVRVAYPFMVNKFRMTRTIHHINQYMRRYDNKVPNIKVSSDDLILLEDYLGDEYAAFTEIAYNAVRNMKELEGIPIEQTYTGKALGGALDWLKKRGEIEKTVLFWDTYNSVDLSEKAATVDYRDLPSQFHKYFTQPTQEETFGR